MTIPDARAAKILTRMHWGSSGWKRPFEEPTPEDRSYAEDAGYLFPPMTTDHDDLVTRTVALASTTDLAPAADAFLASLSTRSLHLRPFLTSAVVARHLPEHSYVPGRRGCAICGVPDREREIDLNVLNFERHRWGGVRHLDVAFLWFALDRFAVESVPTPTAEDHGLLTAILDGLRDLPASTTLTQAEPVLRLLRSNKDERCTLLEALAIMDVLASPGHPGFLHRFVDEQHRELPPKHFMDRGYPGEWWQAGDGIDEETVAELFPHLRGA